MKQFIASILSAATLSVASPVFAQVGPGYVPAYRPTVWTVCLNDPSTSVNLRSGPTRNSTALGRLYHGQPLIVLRRFISSDGMYWVQVRSPIGGGYVRDDYTCD